MSGVAGANDAWPARISQLLGHRERVRTEHVLWIAHVASISLLVFRSRSIPAPDTDDALTRRRIELSGT